MVKQYIGARYVPKFYENPSGGSEWTANTAYEPLTIVTYGSNSYTSKSDVPASIGNPNENPSYWASTGNYNAQVEEYRQQTIALQADVDKITAQTLERNVLLIGDSYSIGTDTAGNTVPSWSTLLQSYMTFNYCKVIHQGGSGFTGKDGASSGASENLRWINMLKDYVAETDAATLNSINAVYLVGGFNDHYAATAPSIRNYMQEFFTYARSVMPNAKYYLGMVGWAGIGTCTTPQGTFDCGEVRYKLRTVVLPAYNSCGLFGCSYIGNLFACLHDYGNAFSTDHYHPSASGQMFIARSLASYILSSNYEISFSQISTLSTVNGNINSFNTNLYSDIVGVTRYGGNGSFSISGGLDVPVNTGVMIGTLTSGCILGSPRISLDVKIYYDGAFRPGALEINAKGELLLWNFGTDALVAGNDIQISYSSTSFPIADC